MVAWCSHASNEGRALLRREPRLRESLAFGQHYHRYLTIHFDRFLTAYFDRVQQMVAVPDEEPDSPRL